MDKIDISIQEEQAFDLVIKVDGKEPSDVYTDLGEKPNGTPINVTVYEFDAIRITMTCPAANYSAAEIFDD